MRIYEVQIDLMWEFWENDWRYVRELGYLGDSWDDDIFLRDTPHALRGEHNFLEKEIYEDTWYQGAESENEIYRLLR